MREKRRREGAWEESEPMIVAGGGVRGRREELFRRWEHMGPARRGEGGGQKEGGRGVPNEEGG